MSTVLLDTCAMIFVANGEAIDPKAQQKIMAAATSGGILVSPVSAWEIGLLSGKKGIVFQPDPRTWFQSFLAYPGVRLTPLTPEIAIASSFLPPLPAAALTAIGAGPGGSPLRGDPADRLLIATARALDVPIVTRDRAILTYAQAGLVRAIAC